MVCLCICATWMTSPLAEFSFLLQYMHLKCLAFWWVISTFSSSNSRSQYLHVYSRPVLALPYQHHAFWLTLFRLFVIPLPSYQWRAPSLSPVRGQEGL